MKNLPIRTCIFVIVILFLNACVPAEVPQAQAPQTSEKWDAVTWDNLIWADETPKVGELGWDSGGNWDELNWAE